MPDYKEVTNTIRVPANTGLAGFLHTLKEILKQPRVSTINIDARGSVTYKRHVLVTEDEPEQNYGVNFDTLQPAHVIRNSHTQEFLPPSGLPASTVIGMMFERAAREQYNPLAFVTGADTSLWRWYRYTTGHELEAGDTLFGLPLLKDRHIPDTALVLCAGYGRDAEFIDTRTSYKFEMPSYTFPDTTVEVML